MKYYLRRVQHTTWYKGRMRVPSIFTPPYLADCRQLHCPVLKVKRADVDALTMRVRAHGTKTHARDREVYVDAWAWSYAKRAIRHLTPSALLFPEVNRWSASDAHREACKALGADFADYRMHDARHSYAVRVICAGAPLEHVAVQLGHADTQTVVKVYGRCKPNESERREWERIAALQDVERAKSATSRGA
jgi:integrase